MESELKKRSRWPLLLPLLFLATAGHAAPNPELETGEGSITGTLPPPRATKLEGYVELRPSWVPNDSAVRLENNVYFGPRFSNGWLLAYRQEFQNDLAGGQGRDITLGDGWIEYSAYPAVQRGPFTVNAEFHGIVPVASAATETKLVAGARTYLEGMVAVLPRVGLFSRLMPRWNVYGSGQPTADRILFENQFEIGPYANFFSDKLTLRLLARWTLGRIQAVGGAAQWQHQLQLTPEVRYQFSPQLVLGLGQCSGSMIESDFGGKADGFASAFRESTWQFIVQVTL